MIKFLIKFLILICLIIKTHSWYWYNYPSPTGTTYWKCGITKSAYVCDPDAMLTDQQRKEIVELVEDFKEKTRRPNSILRCMREGLRLIVALAKEKIGVGGDYPYAFTGLCSNAGSWMPADETKCESDVHGIELNSNSFHYCYQIHWLKNIHEEEYEKLNKTETDNLKRKDYFAALKNYITKLRVFYIHRFSMFDNPDASNENNNITLLEVHNSLQNNKKILSEMRQLQDQMLAEKNITAFLEFRPTSQQFFNNLSGAISIILCLILSLVLFFIIWQIRQLKNELKNELNQRNAPKIELQLMTPMQPVESVENKKNKKKEVEETPKNLLNL